MVKRYDMVIQGGLLVNGSGIRRADVGIEGELIVSIAPEIPQIEARHCINASGKYVMPGAIDVHVHPIYEDDLRQTAVTAAHGGITTLIHFAYAKPGDKLVEIIAKFKEEGERLSCLDFGIHLGILDPDSQIDDIPEAVNSGVPSFKMFMAYPKLMTNDYQLAAAMDMISSCGGLAMVHAENGPVGEYLEHRSVKKGENSRESFLKTRPNRLEAEAIFRAISISEVTNCPLYIVHVSTASGAELIRMARAEGQRVYAETCPQYLTLTQSTLLELGPLAKIGPPLRTESDREALWKAIETEVIDVVASDHAPKHKTADDPFLEAPYGSPQAETMVPLTYDEGVNTGRISPCRFVQLLSENPAKIFGLYPRKGTISEGADADILIFDPSMGFTITAGDQHSKAHYTLYEGRTCLGRPVLTIQRGRILLEGGILKEKEGTGGFLFRKAGVMC
jgi:dihydropyrimidinase